MNIQYSKKKQEMRQDPVMDSLAKAKKVVESNTNSFIAGAVIVVVAVAGLAAYRSMRDAGVAKAQEAFGNAMVAYESGDKQKAIDALDLVVEGHGGTPQAAYSAFLIGSMLLEEKRYDEAQRWLEMARAKSGRVSLVKGMALEALGSCYEAQGDASKAADVYAAALKEDGVSYRHPAIKWKLALVEQQKGMPDKAMQLCREIVGDTLAVSYKEKAENLLTEIHAKQAM